MKEEKITITNAQELRQEKCNVPTLRFPNYSGEWQVSSMGKVCTFRKGYGFSKENLSSDGTPCILYGELYTTYKTAIAKSIKSKTNLDPTILFHSKKNDVIIPCSGETAEDIATSVCIPYDDILLGGDLTVIRSDLDGAFLSNQINSVRKYDIARIAQGKSIVHLQADELKKISIAYPTIDEQQKISGFIDKIDERIEVQNKIISKYETLIKGISCDSFSKQPNHIAKLKDLIIKGKAGGTPSSAVAEYYNGDIPFLSISDMTKQGKYVEFTEKHISENGLGNSSAWIVPPNSLILSMYASVGLVCINKVPLATSQAMFSMVLKDSNMLDYIYYYLNFFRETQIHRLLETGTQSNINADTVRDIEIPFYSNILVFVKTLQAIENRLNNEKDMLSRLMDLKTYLLSSLFI